MTSRARTSGSAAAVFAIYLTLPVVALSALPVEQVGGEFQTLLGQPPEEGGFQNDPILGVVENLGIEEGALLDALEIYVGILAATILFVATNAGVIGASRITYSMATYRQLPEVFRRLHPRFKTPWLALLVFAGLISILTLLPGETDVPRDDVLVRRDALVHDRARRDRRASLPAPGRGDRLQGPPQPASEGRGLAAVRDRRRARAPALAWLVVVVQEEGTRWAGLGWLALGFAGYAIYRLRVVRVPLRATVRAPVMVLGPSLTVEYRTIVVPVVRTAESEEALVAAARLAAERGSRVAVVHVIEVPLDLPLDVQLPDAEAEADEILDQSPRSSRATASAPSPVCSGRAPRARRSSRRRTAGTQSSSSSGAPRPRVARGPDLRPDRRLRPQAQPLTGADRRRTPSRVTVALAWVMIALGLAVVVRTLAAGVGGGLGLVLGALLVLAGGLRLYLHRGERPLGGEEAPRTPARPRRPVTRGRRLRRDRAPRSTSRSA